MEPDTARLKAGFKMELIDTPATRGLLLVALHWVVTSWFGKKFVCPLLAQKSGLTSLRSKQFEDPPKYTARYAVTETRDWEKKPDSYQFPSTPKTPVGVNADGVFQNTTSRHFHEAYLSGKTTPTKVAQLFVKSIALDAQQIQPIQPVGIMDESDIMQQAAASDERFKSNRPLGPLDGVPILVKGDFDVKGYETTCGTTFLNKGKAAVEDAEAVYRLRAAGALIFGKTRMHELGCDVTNNNPAEGTPRNPYNVHHYTGGSSGGSACAVAAGLCPIALGDDGGGSIRIPAAHCGVFGLKPSINRVSLRGVYPLGLTVGYAGPIAGTAEDLALAYSVIAGPNPELPDSYDPPPLSLRSLRDTASLTGLRIGYHRTWMGVASDDIQAAVRRTLRSLEERGAKLIDVGLDEIEETRVAHLITIGSELSHCSRRFRNDMAKLGFATQMSICVIANSVLSADYLQAQQVRTRATRHLEALFQTVDVLATPTTGLTAPRIRPSSLQYGESDMRVSSRVMAYIFHGNLCGVPAISCPAGYDSKDLPIGIQFMASWYNEDVLLRLANVCEELIRPSRKKPKVWYGDYEL